MVRAGHNLSELCLQPCIGISNAKVLILRGKDCDSDVIDSAGVYQISFFLPARIVGGVALISLLETRLVPVNEVLG